MRPNREFFVARTLCGLAAIFLIAQAAGAHAVLLESNPGSQSQVAGPDVAIQLRFNVRIDASRSRLTLVRPDGSAQTLELCKPAAPNTLTSHAKALSSGAYRLRWQVLASDGHLTRGEIPFAVTTS
jgi:methionine-rich copper-binding protein CopC